MSSIFKIWRDVPMLHHRPFLCVTEHLLLCNTLVSRPLLSNECHACL
eukprot:XP_001709627.1 Hypothetical protein GL50803_35275 [Giardia lamblia ATCC 50803]